MRALAVFLLLLPSAAFAQDADETALRAQLRAAQDQIATDTAEIAQLRAGGAASAQDVAAAQNAQLRQDLQSLQAAANNAIKNAHAQDKLVATALSDRNDACVNANQKLVAISHDILHLYETQSFRGILLKSYEPILGLDRVKLENIVQDYDDKIHDQQITPTASGELTP